MRARRVKAEDLKLGEIAVAFDHPELGALAGAAEDVSIHGLSVVVRGEPGGLRTGDRIDHVRVSCDAGVLHDGNAVVRRVTERGDVWVIGLELPAGLDLGRIYRSASRRDFASRWQALKQRTTASRVRPQFKAWVADLRAALVSAQELLGAEERALASEDRRRRVEAEADYLAVIAPDLLETLEQAKHDLARMVDGFTEAEHAEHRAYCALHLGPLLGTSPFLRRAREKPLGYAGDYEMMNMLYRDPAEGESLFARALNICFTHEPAAQANKNRISYIGNLIRKALDEHPGRRIRIASLGCGPAREIEALLENSPELGKRLDVALIDQEERAIAYCERTLGPLAAATGARIQYIREGLRALLTRDSLADKLGARELIYSAGLFDYLEQRMFARITSVLYEALVPSGVLAIGNVAAHNPSRWVMEYFSEWFLIHRTPEQLLGLAADLQPRPTQVTVDAEPSGINLFLLVRR
jgi:extracellular factor (EF) 3-hydroxypalmitic acid methyl ester biosynthesis protein